MNLIKNTLILVSCVYIAISSLEAKSIEILLDHKVSESINLSEELQEDGEESPSIQTSFQQVKIENIGKAPLKNFFPFVNNPPTLTLNKLADKIAKEDNPLLTLFQIWNSSLTRAETVDEIDCHPLDLLNFRGACTETVFYEQFLKLCNALGIETRRANVQGREVYDFCLGDEWVFFDMKEQQFYLNLDNERLSSSEMVMDDPFLALRTKHSRKASCVDFNESWKQLASFNILQPTSAAPINHSTKMQSTRSTGFTLFPDESIIFKSSNQDKALLPSQCSISHVINLAARRIKLEWEYLSPCPVRQLTNNSAVSIRLIEQNVQLNPGESFDFNGEIFGVKIKFASQPKGTIRISGTCSQSLIPSLSAKNNIVSLGTENNPTCLRFSYKFRDKEAIAKLLCQEKSPKLRVINTNTHFDYISPYFMLESSLADADSSGIDKIWWQIALDKEFRIIPSNLDQVEPFHWTVALPAISETFLSPESTYYFRIKGSKEGHWGEWSSVYSFKVRKPAAVESVEFDQMSDGEYELNWKRYAEQSEDPIEYLIFGSNAVDFIPSIYCTKQVNAIVESEIAEEEINDNLIEIVTEPKIRINGSLAYYRIIAEQKGQLSVPSAIIRVYDTELVQPRNALQVVEEGSHFIAKRQLFPPSYPWMETALPSISSSARSENSLVRFQELLCSVAKLDQKKHAYELPDLSDEIWEEVRPYLLPGNHPAWAKMNRIFCNTRATQSPEHFKRAGFRRWRPGRWSRVAASSHPECEEYFIKAYCDTELGIIYDWRKWIHRINGAEAIRNCIREHELQAHFKVPHKWIYPLPKNPSPPDSSQYARKNFILICENMSILEHSKNEKAYKHHMDKKLMEGLYTILQVCGLYDSVYVFNIPFCKDGKIAVIDTEYFYKWPVPFRKLNRAFSKDLQLYWQKLTFNGGKIPDGENIKNPPRMDRRDVRE